MKKFFLLTKSTSFYILELKVEKKYAVCSTMEKCDTPPRENGVFCHVKRDVNWCAVLAFRTVMAAQLGSMKC